MLHCLLHCMLHVTLNNLRDGLDEAKTIFGKQPDDLELISSCLEFWGQCQYLWGLKFSHEASLSHTYSISLQHTASGAPNHPETPWTESRPLWIKSNSHDQIRLQMQTLPDTFPVSPRTPLTSSLHCIYPPSLSHFACTGGERQKEKNDSIFDFKERRKIDKHKEAKLLHTRNTYTLKEVI